MAPRHRGRVGAEPGGLAQPLDGGGLVEAALDEGQHDQGVRVELAGRRLVERPHQQGPGRHVLLGGVCLPASGEEERGARGVARRCGLRDVAGLDPGRGIRLLEDERSAGVRLLELIRRDHLVDDRGDQGVLAPERPARAHQRELAQRLGGPLDVGHLDADHRGEVGGRGVAVEDHRGLEHLERLGTQRLERMGQRPRHLRGRGPLEAAEQLGGVERAGTARGPEQGRQQEGAAAGGVVVGGGDLLTGRRADRVGEEGVDLLHRERGQLDAPRRRLVQQSVERGQPQPRSLGGHGEHQPQRADLDAADEVVEPGGRRGVAPVDVVDGDQHGLRGTAVEEGLLERAEQLEELVVRKAAPAGAAEEVAHLATERPVAGLDLGGELLEDAERGGGLLHGTARPEHPHARLAGDVAHRVHHRGLAQAWGALDHDARRSAGPSGPAPGPSARPGSRRGPTRRVAPESPRRRSTVSSAPRSTPFRGPATTRPPPTPNFALRHARSHHTEHRVSSGKPRNPVASNGCSRFGGPSGRLGGGAGGQTLRSTGRETSAKKSLPLSSTTMNAGKSSTSIFHTASMPSSAYSSTSTLVMQSWASRAAGPPIEPR